MKTVECLCSNGVAETDCNMQMCDDDSEYSSSQCSKFSWEPTNTWGANSTTLHKCAFTGTSLERQAHGLEPQLLAK